VGTDITEHPTRQGKVSCWVVLDVFSHRVVGWSIDTHQATPLVTNALGMAISNRDPRPEQTVIQSDHGSHSTSWVDCSGNTKVHLCSRSATDPSQRRQTVTHRQRTPQPEPTSPHWQRDLRTETYVA
jgi:hypothetical protein